MKCKNIGFDLLQINTDDDYIKFLMQFLDQEQKEANEDLYPNFLIFLSACNTDLKIQIYLLRQFLKNAQIGFPINHKVVINDLRRIIYIRLCSVGRFISLVIRFFKSIY